MQRVWAVLEEKQTPYQYIEVNPYHKAESFLRLNPRGLVPTLEFDGKPLYESTVICEFLEDQYKGHGRALLPSDAFQKAHMRLWIDFVTTRIIPSFHRFLQHQNSQTSLGTLDECRQAYLNNLKQFVEPMDAEGPFFAGKEPMLADFVLAPWCLRHWVFDHYKGGLGVPAEGQAGSDEPLWVRWRKWAHAIGQRRSLLETTSERQHYLPIFER